MVGLLKLRELLKQGRVVLRLMRDSRVPLYAKLVVVVAVAYVLSPIDIVPEVIPVLGQLDDIAFLLASATFFIRLCPPEVVEEHEAALGYQPRRTVEGKARPIRPEEG